MKKLTIRDARKSLSHLEQLLADEEEMMITRRGKTIARVVQVSQARPIPSQRDLREGMPRIKRGSEKIVRQDRDAR